MLLHSTVCDRGMWDPQWPVFVDAGYRVMRCDFRGYGATPVPRGPHNDADDVLGLLGELGAGQAAVVGASYGGKVALEIAARWPQRVTALALVCAAMPGHEPIDVLRNFWRRGGELIDARLTVLLPGAQAVELPWAGHLPTLERPQELSAMLTAFLRETVPAG